MSTPDNRARDAIDRIREDAADGELQEEIESMSDEEIAKALAAAGTSADEARAQVRELLGTASPPKETVAEVVPLAPRRRRFARATVWLVAAALAAIGGGTVAFVATRDEGFGDNRVASPACLVMIPSGMTIEGTVVRRGEAYELDLTPPLCGRESGFVTSVTLTGAIDLAPLAGRKVKVEGRPLDGDTGPVLFEIRRVSGT